MNFNEVKAVRLWDDSIVDMNNIKLIREPMLWNGGARYVYCIIETLCGKEIKIEEEVGTSDYLPFNPTTYTSPQSKKDYGNYWKCIDGAWKDNPSLEEIKCYIEFKEKVDGFILFWNDNKPVLEVGGG